MRKRVRTVALVTAMLTALSTPGIAACSEKKGTGSVTVQSVYPTFKVMQNATEFAAGEAKLDVQLAKGETESGQLILTANGDVSSYELIASDIKNENGDAFGLDNIEVDVQYYVNVQQKTAGNNNEAYPTGWTPDMLLPMELCIEAGENTIADGNNQGLTVEFTADSDTPAGTYTGSFTLKADKHTYDIPVSVEVWDIDVSKCYGQTWLGIELGQLWYGELDTSDEMYKAYYDSLLNEYKSCGGQLPGTYNLDTFIQTLDSYWENPNFTTYEIPAFKDWYISESVLYDYMYLLAASSTPDRLYLERAIILPFDEPQANVEVYDDRVNVCTQQVEAAKEAVWQQLIEEGHFDEYEGGQDGAFARALKDSLDVPSVITSPDIDYWGDVVMTYCPPIQHYETQLQRTAFADHAEHRNTEQWYYTCMQPVYPYPSHHIDDYLIGSRSMRWMQKAYNLEGYLFWCVNQYAQSTETGHIPIDLYTNPARFFFNSRTFNGDGFMFYPGKKYGLNEPFGSLRLDALRDGQEDYNLMCVYQEKLNSLAQFYGWENVPDVNDILSVSYDNLFNGSIYIADDEALFTARELLARKATLANSTSKFHYETLAGEDGKTQAVFYVADETTTVEFNGKKLTDAVACGDGFKYTAEFSVATTKELSVKVTKDGVTQQFTESLGASMTALQITEGDLTDYMSFNDGTTARIIDGGVEITLRSDASEDNSYIPRIDLNKKLFGGDLKKVQTVSFDMVYTPTCVNSGDHAAHYVFEKERVFSVNIAPTAEGKGVVIERFGIDAAAERVAIGESEGINVRCGNVYQKAALNKGEYFSLQFSNLRDLDFTFEDAVITITNIQYSRRG